MTPERWAQIRQVFEGAVERPEADRAAYLRVVCSNDDALRKEVEALLASHENTRFMDRPAVDVGALMSSGTIRNMGAYVGDSRADDDPNEYQQGYRVGPYQLQKRIGRGGMGSVWLANRFDQEFHRTVAVKLVHRGMDTQEILRRFRLERQLLAGLEHPNIARLIDGGSTAEGLPFLAMEYVEGIRIDQFCEDRHLSISDRLKLFRQVCSAVQYAHQNLVVHRDIKASNILVTGDGTPKLLDFGIAKLIRTEFSTLAAAETRPEFRPMTLDYASPEQVRGEPITTSTDVYSLGVLLYKLLTGKFPYGVTNRNQAAIQHAIGHLDPIPPSAVILADASASIPNPTQKMEVMTETRFKARKRLRKKLTGDLDMIILKALRKEPHKRYESVEQFSGDIQRYLEGRPVLARSDTFGYRMGKFLRRNWAAATAASVLVVSLVAAALLLANNARQAVAERARAEAHSQTAQELALRQQSELTRAYFELAEMQSAQGDRAGTLATYRAALEASRRFVAAYPSTLGALSVARSAIRAGDAVEDSEEALRLYREAATQFEALTAQSYAFGPEDIREQIALGRRLGLAQFARQDLLGALSTFSRALQQAEKLNDRPLIASANFWVAETLAHNNAADASLGRFRKSFETWRDLARSAVQAPLASPAEYEKALAALAAKAPEGIRSVVDSDLAAFRQR